MLHEKKWGEREEIDSKNEQKVNEDSSFVYFQSLIATFNALFESDRTEQRCCQANEYTHSYSHMKTREREKGQ